MLLVVKRVRYLLLTSLLGLGVNGMFSLFFPSDLKAAQSSPSIGSAERYLDNGDLSRARSIARKLLKQKKLSPRLFKLLGQIEYAQGNLRKAAIYFRQADVRTMDDRASFEYGVAAYAERDCRRALDGLNRVATNFNLKNYSNLLAATCYLTNEENYQAYMLLVQAYGLPTKFENIRLFLLHTAEQRMAHQQSGLPIASGVNFLLPVDVGPQSFPGTSNANLIQRQRDEPVPLRYKRKKRDKDLKIHAKKAGEHKADDKKNWELYITPKVYGSYMNETKDYSGMKFTQEVINSKKAEVNVYSKYNLNGPAVSGYLGAARSNSEEVLKEEWYERDDDGNGVLKEKENPKSYWHYSERKGGAYLWLPIYGPTNSNWAYEYYDKAPDKEGYRYTSHGPSVTLFSEVAMVKGELKLSMRDIKNEDGYEWEKQTQIEAKISKDMLGGNLSLRGDHLRRKIPEEKVPYDSKYETTTSLNFYISIMNWNTNSSVSHKEVEPGADSRFISGRALREDSFFGSIERGFGMFWVKGAASYTLFEEDFERDLRIGDAYGETKSGERRNAYANGARLWTKAEANMNLFEWVNIGPSYEYNQRKFLVTDPEVAADYLRRDYKHTLQSKVYLSLSVSRSF